MKIMISETHVTMPIDQVGREKRPSRACTAIVLPHALNAKPST